MPSLRSASITRSSDTHTQMGSSREPSNEGTPQPAGGLRNLVKAYRDAAPYLALGIQLAATVVIVSYAGYWADQHFGTGPWLLLAGLGIGAAAGLYNFFKTIIDLGKKEEKE